MMRNICSKKRSLEIGFVMAAALFLFGAAGIAYAGSAELNSNTKAGSGSSTELDSLVDSILSKSQETAGPVSKKNSAGTLLKKQDALALAMNEVALWPPSPGGEFITQEPTQSSGSGDIFGMGEDYGERQFVKHGSGEGN